MSSRRTAAIWKHSTEFRVMAMTQIAHSRLDWFSTLEKNCTAKCSASGDACRRYVVMALLVDSMCCTLGGVMGCLGGAVVLACS